MLESGQKRCNVCKQAKDRETEFGNFKRNKDGKRGECSICHRENNKKYRESHLAQIKAKKAWIKYYRANCTKLCHEQKKIRERQRERRIQEMPATQDTTAGPSCRFPDIA